MGIIYKHAKEPIPQLPAELAVLQPLLESLMAKRPDDRYPSAKAALRAIEEAQAALPEAGLAA
jgi:hypothetical protein